MNFQTTIGKTSLRLVVGDIADQNTDAVVTAAHWKLNKGAGTDGTIHTKGGPKIYEECKKIGGCPIGDAVITTGGNLKARHVIHAASMGLGGVRTTAKTLQTSTAHSLRLAAERGLRTIAFPAVGTGVSGFPMQQCAEIMLSEAAEHLNQETSLETIYFVLFDEASQKVFATALDKLATSG